MSTFTVTSSINEAGGQVITVTRTAGTGAETLSYSTVFDGTATAADLTAVSGTNTLAFSNAVSVQTFTINAVADTLLEGAETFHLSFVSNKPVQTPAFTKLVTVVDTSICFMAGTMIRTPEGETAVEKLEIGQRVTLADGRTMPVKWIGIQTIAPRFADPLKSAPICIKAGALGDNVPSRDLYTSAGHSMVLDGNLVIAGAMVNGRSIVRAEFDVPRIVYYHVELEEHAVIFANDAATESFVDNVSREKFDNEAEFRALYPNAKPIVAMDMPTVKSARQLPAATRKHLAERAAAIGAAAEKAA